MVLDGGPERSGGGVQSVSSAADHLYAFGRVDAGVTVDSVVNLTRRQPHGVARPRTLTLWGHSPNNCLPTSLPSCVRAGVVLFWYAS